MSSFTLAFRRPAGNAPFRHHGKSRAHYLNETGFTALQEIADAAPGQVTWKIGEIKVFCRGNSRGLSDQRERYPRLAALREPMMGARRSSATPPGSNGIEGRSPDDIGLRVNRPSRPLAAALCASCASDRDFASCFLQIPPRGGHPCSLARGSCHLGPQRTFTSTPLPGSLSLPGSQRLTALRAMPGAPTF